jgi:hypothetical protein
LHSPEQNRLIREEKTINLAADLMLFEGSRRVHRPLVETLHGKGMFQDFE